MSGLQIAWALALLVTLCTLPVGIIRTVIYRSGDIDHTRTMRIVAAFALTLGLVSLAVFLSLSVVLAVLQVARGS
jgi:hypothetical protein